MDIKYVWVIWLGAVVALGMVISLFIRNKKKGNTYEGGKKIAGPLYSRDEDYFKRKMTVYRSCMAALLILSIVAVVSAFVMMARPYSKERVQDERYCRDIMLCIDISTSVDYLNENLLEELKKTVDELHGERFGIVIFNTSPVLLSPLTDDYEFIKEQLDMIDKSLKVRNSEDDSDLYSTDLSSMYDWLYYEGYITSGTLVGNEQRGSSLIGDGLAAAACDFSDKDKTRTKIMIFSTDNDIQGNPVATLDDAASICKNNGVTVYGVGTKEMTDENRESMKKAVESTGGQFFMEEESGTFDQIVTAIEKSSKNQVDAKMIVQEKSKVEWPFVALLIIFVMMTCIGRVIKL